MIRRAGLQSRPSARSDSGEYVNLFQALGSRIRPDPTAQRRFAAPAESAARLCVSVPLWPIFFVRLRVLVSSAFAKASADAVALAEASWSPL